jgi:V8-like Glu-specific endopeptidase
MGRSKRAALRISLNMAVLATTAGLAASTALAATPAASTPAASTPAVIHSVAKSAQLSTMKFWTRARMDSATPVGGASPTAGSSTSGPPPGIPNPIHFSGVRTVGALFFTTGSQTHFCTASVVDSATLNLILTAAHCVYDTSYATNIAYVPEWHNGISPYGEWPVQSVVVAKGWTRSQDPSLDFAFLTVAPPTTRGLPIQLVTGGLRLGINVGYRHNIYVIGLNNTDSRPLGCATKSFEFEPGQMEFYCNSFWDGTSGGPWILHLNRTTGSGIVFGDIGGYEQGGDYAWTSYSDYYGAATLQLFVQAQAARSTGR